MLWLPRSASEWKASLSIDAEPEVSQPHSFAEKTPMLPSIAARNCKRQARGAVMGAGAALATYHASLGAAYRAAADHDVPLSLAHGSQEH